MTIHSHAGARVDADTVAARADRPRRRGLTIVLWCLQVLAAIVIGGAGASTLAGAEQPMATFAAIGAGDWFRYLVGVLEVAGAVGLLVPRLHGLAALALVGLWLGAIATHVLLIGGSSVPAAVLLVLCAVIAWARRHETTALIRTVVGGHRG